MAVGIKLMDLIIGNTIKLTKEECIIIEIELFARICEELKQMMQQQYEDYFKTLKITDEKEKEMIESNFIRNIINDILSTEEYSLAGIAYYTNTPEDVIFEIAIGRNMSPSFSLSQKIIHLHRSVRSNLYDKIFNKIKTENLLVAIQ